MMVYPLRREKRYCLQNYHKTDYEDTSVMLESVEKRAKAPRAYLFSVVEKQEKYRNYVECMTHSFLTKPKYTQQKEKNQ
jgi:hypothetical protein